MSNGIRRSFRNKSGKITNENPSKNFYVKRAPLSDAESRNNSLADSDQSNSSLKKNNTGIIGGATRIPRKQSKSSKRSFVSVAPLAPPAEASRRGMTTKNVSGTSGAIRASRTNSSLQKHVKRMSSVSSVGSSSAASTTSSKLRGRQSTFKMSASVPKQTIKMKRVKSFDPFSTDYDDPNEETETFHSGDKDNNLDSKQRRTEWIQNKEQEINKSNSVDNEVLFPNNFPGDKGEEDFITLTKLQLDQLVEQRINGGTQKMSDKDKEIKSLKKQVDELKFFQELDSDDGDESDDGVSDGSKAPSPEKKKRRKSNKENKKSTWKTEYTEEIEVLKQHLSRAEGKAYQLEAENTHVRSTLKHIKQDNISLQAVVEASSPKALSSPEAYKKALRLQGELHEARSALQEESLEKERAETNLDCYKVEIETKLKDAEERETSMRGNVKDMSNDLQEGVNIMKGLEEELQISQTRLKEEMERAQEVQKKLDELGKEQSNTSQLYEKQLGNANNKLKENEATFSKEKKELELKCTQLEEATKMMKKRVNEMEAKRGMQKKDLMENSNERNKIKELEKSLLEKDADHTKMVSLIEAENQERIRASEQTLQDKVVEVNVLQDKVVGLESILAKVKSQTEEDGTKLNGAYSQLKHEHENCLIELTEAQEMNVQFEREVKNLYEESVLKAKEIKVLQEKVEELPAMAKQTVSIKAKEHQYMRDKKKWSMTEQRIREQISVLQDESSTLEEENQQLLQYKEGLDKEVIYLRKENELLDSKVKIMSKTIEMHNSSIETSEEVCCQRIKSLEQELCRAQSKASPHVEIQKLQQALQCKDKELEQSHQIAGKAMEQIKNLKSEKVYTTQRHQQTPKKEYHSGSPFDHYRTNDEIMGSAEDEIMGSTQDEIMGSTSSVEGRPWDTDDEWKEARTPVARGDGTRRKFVSPITEQQPERARIENDALRKYIRQRKALKKANQ